MRKLRVPLLIALVCSLGLGLGLGWKLKRDRAAALGVVTSSRKIRVLALTGALPPSLLKSFRSVENIEVELVEEPTPDAVMQHLDHDSRFDVVTLLTSQLSRALQGSKIQSIGPTEIANYSNISHDFLDLPIRVPLAVPIAWGLLGFVYAPENVDDILSWSAIFELDRETKIFLKPYAFETQRFAKFGMPQPFADNALQDRIKKFNSIYKHAERFLVDPSKAEAEGDVVEISLSEATIPAYKEMTFVLPRERALVWILNLALSSNVKNLAEANTFLGFCLKPESALEIALSNHEASTNVRVENSNLLPTQKPSSLRRIPLTQIELSFDDLKN